MQSQRKRPFRLTPEVAREHDVQRQVANMLWKVLRPEVCWTSIDHANAKDRLTGSIRKGRGVKAGVPDVLLWFEGRAFAIELKSEAGVLTLDQQNFIECLLGARVQVAICRSVSETFERVRDWGLTRVREGT